MPSRVIANFKLKKAEINLLIWQLFQLQFHFAFQKPQLIFNKILERKIAFFIPAFN